MRLILVFLASWILPVIAVAETIEVGPGNFAEAETSRYMTGIVMQGGFGKLVHRREHVKLDQQTVIRMNHDTLYSGSLFDLDAGPVTITVPKTADGRYIAGQIISQNHHTAAVLHAGTHVITREDVGTRYAIITFRVFADFYDPADIAIARTVQDQILVEQEGQGSFEVAQYDKKSLDRAREALLSLALLDRAGLGRRMGAREEVDPLAHVIATASGWGLLPESEAAYWYGKPRSGYEDTPHVLSFRDVPTEAFWSVTVYNPQGFMVPNDLGVNAFNSANAKQEADGSYRIQFGGCETDMSNCIPVPEGWNYVFRAYRPSQVINVGAWSPPDAEPAE